MDDAPQVQAILPLTRNGSLRLNGLCRKRLNASPEGPLSLIVAAEVVLAEAGAGPEVALDEKGRLWLPDAALVRLGCADSAQKHKLALVERPQGLALKRFEVVEEPSEWANVTDIETETTLTRLALTQLPPEHLLPIFESRAQAFALHFPIEGFVQGRATLEAWRARQALGAAATDDEALRGRLLAERVAMQRDDGSWRGETPYTARVLGELCALGCDRSVDAVMRGVGWLLARPQSDYNPGMWFATDDLVREQAEVMAIRATQSKAGGRARFNARRAAEVNAVRAGDPLIAWPCGPRITWTTALVLQSLLALGFGDDPRVATALQTLTAEPFWCDNQYQHGPRGRVNDPVLAKAHWEQVRSMYRYGGLLDRDQLEHGDASHQPFYLRRQAGETIESLTRYPLRMPDVGGGCSLMMVRGVAGSSDPHVRDLAHAWLWLFAGWQRGPDGRFAGDVQRIFGHVQAMFMQVFARYDHLLARLCLLRMLPWVVAHQNRDGSWGEGELKDVVTLSVVQALGSLRLT